MLIDTHFHLDLMENMQCMIRESNHSDVGIIAVGTTPKAFSKEEQWCSDAKAIKVALGFHPQLVATRKQELGLFLELLERSVFIGEIGLDFNYEFYSSKEHQLDCFHAIANACAKKGNKVLSIHSVKSASGIIHELAETGAIQNNVCIFHWFTGSPLERKMAIDLGAWFSINPLMLSTKSGQETVKAIPIDRILLETDAPFTKKIGSILELEAVLNKLIDDISVIRGEDVNSQIEYNSQRIWNTTVFS